VYGASRALELAPELELELELEAQSSEVGTVSSQLGARTALAAATSSSPAQTRII